VPAVLSVPSVPSLNGCCPVPPTNGPSPRAGPAARRGHRGIRPQVGLSSASSRPRLGQTGPTGPRPGSSSRVGGHTAGWPLFNLSRALAAARRPDRSAGKSHWHETPRV